MVFIYLSFLGDLGFYSIWVLYFKILFLIVDFLIFIGRDLVLYIKEGGVCRFKYV